MKPLENKNLISLQDATKFCNYSQEYLSLRARRKKLKAVKVGRNWMTTKEWIDAYLKRVGDYKEILEQKQAAKKIAENKNKFGGIEIEIQKGEEEPIIASLADELVKAESKKVEPPENLPTEDSIKPLEYTPNFVEESEPAKPIIFAVMPDFKNDFQKIEIKKTSYNPELRVYKAGNNSAGNMASGKELLLKDYLSYSYPKKSFFESLGPKIIFSLSFFAVCLGFILIASSIFMGFSRIIKPINYAAYGISYLAEESLGAVSNDLNHFSKAARENYPVVDDSMAIGQYTKDTFKEYFAWLGRETNNKAAYIYIGGSSLSASIADSLRNYTNSILISN